MRRLWGFLSAWQPSRTAHSRRGWKSRFRLRIVWQCLLVLLLVLAACSTEPVTLEETEEVEEVHDAITGAYEGVFMLVTPMTEIVIEEAMVALIRRFGDDYVLSFKPLGSLGEPRVVDCDLDTDILTCSYTVETAYATTLSGVIAEGQWLGTITSTARGAQGTFIFHRLPQASPDED